MCLKTELGKKKKKEGDLVMYLHHRNLSKQSNKAKTGRSVLEKEISFVKERPLFRKKSA